MDVKDGSGSVTDVFGSTDLLVHILQFLHEPVDRDAACRVNKSWLHAFQSVPQQIAFRYGPSHSSGVLQAMLTGCLILESKSFLLSAFCLMGGGGFHKTH